MTVQVAFLWGDVNPWYADDPKRCCYTCGQPPTGTYNDGSPRYPPSCDHPPILGRPPGPFRGSLTHTLNARDVAFAGNCARVTTERGNHYRDTWGAAALPEPQRYANNLLGSGGEIAFARLAGLPWRCPTTGFGKPDVGRYQVRTQRPRHDHGAWLHESDHDPIVLMVGTMPTFTILGWLPKASDGKRDEWWTNPGGRRWAWYVPLAALADPWTIPELADLGRTAGVAAR